MQAGFYEDHRHPDPDFPVIFHLDTITSDYAFDFLHWHENIELLYCVEGNGVAVIQSEPTLFSAGELVVVNSGHLHSVYTPDYCQYYCLISGGALFAGSGLPTDEVALQSLVRDEQAGALYMNIADEMAERGEYYTTAVKAGIISLFTYLYRNYREAAPAGREARSWGKQEMVKKAIAYIRGNFEQDIRVDDLCREIGFSKSYLCHTFKELTGQSIVSFLNFTRCSNAKSLLATGRYNVGESARLSGFRNMSYFTSIYKRLMGELPSQAQW